MFRRRAAASTSASSPAGSSGDDVDARPGAKGRPTPKRRDAEAARRPRVAPPADRREAVRREREERRAERLRMRQGLASGDERYLPTRDRGPVRRIVRDTVDSRRNLAEYFLPLALVVLVLSWSRIPALVAVSSLLWLIAVTAIVVDSLLVARRVRRALASAAPKESTKGAVGYGLLRSLQFRRLRLPPPQVKPGRKAATPRPPHQ